MIKLDVSTTSVVVTCTDCSHWFAFAWTKDDGRNSGDAHLINVHDVEPARARDRNRKRLGVSYSDR